MVDHQLSHELYPSGEIVSGAEQLAGCVACAEPLSGVTYTCRDCPAVLHEKCANLPTQILNHALHRNHKLQLVVDPPPNCHLLGSYCQLCFKIIKGKFAYICVADCKLILDISCATLPKFIVGSFPEQEHFFHKHPLVSIDHQVDGSERHFCNACMKSVAEGPIYVCLQCNFWLHRKCLDLPQKINHPSHRKHPLMLVVASSVRQYERLCDLCRDPIRKWLLFYHCSFCKFDLHVDCVSLPRIIKSEFHPHSLDLLLRVCELFCNGCGRIEPSGATYTCTKCNLILRLKDFINKPHSIQVIGHHHKLVHTFSNMSQESDEFECQLCDKKLNPRYAHYCCTECDYVAHLHCAVNRDVRLLPFMSKQKLKYEQTITSAILVDPSSSSSTKETSLLDESTSDHETSEGHLAKILEFETVAERLTIPTVIQHDAHDKPLYLLQHLSMDMDDDGRCHACWLRIIDSSVFKCKDCPFVLHETCAFLPRKLQHWIHSSTLTIGYKRIIVCHACRYETNGFYYTCDTCKFSICLRCKIIPNDLEHPAHIHSLSFNTGREDHACNACGNPCRPSISRTISPLTFACSKCRFFVDYSCLILPEQAQHAYHDHLLTLSFKDDESNLNRMVCHICEENRDPEHWFYNCKDCEFTPSYFKAHTKCVLGKHPFIKVRMNTYITDAHEHELHIIKIYDYPGCGRCKEPIEDEIALGCHESDCNFTQHWKCPTKDLSILCSGGTSTRN